MKPSRLVVFTALALVAVAAVVVGLVFNGSFQTWLLRRSLASRPELHATIGRVDAGWRHVELMDVRVERNGAVLTLPKLETELPLFTAAWSRQLFVSRFVARGWTLDLTKAASAAAPTGARPPPPGGAAAAAQAFAGVFSSLQLPMDVAVDGVDLQGTVTLPAGAAKVSVTGGGLGAKRDGRFEFSADAALQDDKVTAVAVRGELVAAMDTPRTFTGLRTKLNATARGPQFPQGVNLSADAAATRTDAAEAYAISVVANQRDLLHVAADYARNGQRVGGTWKIDVRDADVAPFTLGQPLPAFTVVGEGKFDTDAAFSSLHAVGLLNATGGRLEVILPALAAWGELKVAADFDLAASGGTLLVQKLDASIASAEPVATLRSLQPFEINPRGGQVRATDPAKEIVGIVLQGVPVAWVQPFIPDVIVTGGPLRGELFATPRAGGASLRSTKTLTVAGLAVRQAGRALLDRVDVSLGLTADYAPQGWQAEFAGLTLKSGDATLLTTTVKAGRLAGADQPIKAAGRIDASVAPLLAQPVATGLLVPTAGDVSVDFVASIAASQAIQAKVALRNLATTVQGNSAKLPNVAADVRADIGADGKIAFNAPLQLERNDRKSDLLVAGTIGPERDHARAVDAQLTSEHLFLDDAQALGGLLPPKPAAPADAKAAVLPPWAGVHGAIALQLKRLTYADTFEATNVTGRLRMEAGMLKLENLQAGLGETGQAKVNGTVTFDAAAPLPYALTADFALQQFDPATLFRALNPAQPATVEGRFDVASKLTARGTRLGELALGAGGDFQLTSRAGVFRGLPVNVNHLVENSSKLAGWIASAGTAISSITGRKDYAEIASKSQAVAEFARGLNPIAYDQLSVVLSRDAGLNTTLKNFTLISPEIRLTGTGTALHRANSSLLDDSLAMEFTLRARGRQAELLKYLGALAPATDDFGYAACAIPLRIGGTLAKPDSSEVNSRLAALALEKTGVTEKAADFVNRIFGGK